MSFKKRTTAPKETDKYWYSKSNPYFAQSASPEAQTEAKANGEVRTNLGLPNCTCYAFGRFWEIMGSVPKNLEGNGDQWFENCKQYEKSQTPQVGAIACYGKGSGNGHVTIVEEIKSNGDLLLSESIYNRTPSKGVLFACSTVVKKSQEYRYNNDKPLQGFIINPKYPIVEEKESTIYKNVDYSPVFDAEYYLTNHEDIAEDDYYASRPFEHFIKNGMKERRKAISDFDVNIYKANYVDLQRAFGSNYPKYYEHYCVYGKNENRTGSESVKICAGRKVQLDNAPWFSSYTGKEEGKRTGPYFLWDSVEKNGRIKITTKYPLIGKDGHVTCFVNVKDLKFV